MKWDWLFLYNNIISCTDIYIMHQVLTPVHVISLKLGFKIKSVLLLSNPTDLDHQLLMYNQQTSP